MKLTDILKKNRRAILQAELACLLHDLDKLEPEFIHDSEYHSKPNLPKFGADKGATVRGLRNERWQRLVGKDLEIVIDGLDLSALKFAYSSKNDDEVHNPEREVFGCLSSPFVDHHENRKVVDFSVLSWLFHGGGSGADGLDSALDKQAHQEQAGDNCVIDSPFGMKQGGFSPSALTEVLNFIKGIDFADFKRTEVLEGLRPCFSQALGETRFPCNDVTLWAHSYSAASICKAILAKVMIEFIAGEFSAASPYCIPSRSTAREKNPVDFTLLKIAFDRDFFLGRAQKVGDVVALSQLLAELQGRMKIFIEENLALANQTYLDQGRQLFLLPRLNTWTINGKPAFPGLQERFEAEVISLVTAEVENLLLEFDCQSLPFQVCFASSQNKPKQVADTRILDCSRELLSKPALCRQSARALSQAAGAGQPAAGQGRCEVCGIRLVAAENEKREKLCLPCYLRRHDPDLLARRNQKFNHSTSDLGRLIDADSGENRLLMISASFDLSLLTDGQLIENILSDTQKKEGGTHKNPSPGRLYRAYETLREFFSLFQQELARISAPGIFPVTLSPERFDCVVPAVYAEPVIDLLFSMYENQFSRVRSRLPLHLGALFFYRKFPFYIVLETAERLRRNLRTQTRKWRLASREESEREVILKFAAAGNGTEGGPVAPVAWRQPLRLSDGVTRDNYYQQVSVGEQPKSCLDLAIGDTVTSHEGRFAFLLLDSAARRCAVKPEGIDHHSGLSRAPYYFAEWPHFKRIWGLLAKLSHSQISALEGALFAKLHAWRKHWQPQNEVVERFCEMLLFAPNAFGKKGHSGNYLYLDNASNQLPPAADSDRQVLLRAAVSGHLLDVIDFYLHMLGQKKQEG